MRVAAAKRAAGGQVDDLGLADKADASASVKPRRFAIVIAVGLPTILAAFHALAYGRWIVDDAAITFAYVRSMAEGHGPVFQELDDPVEGFSNPAWLALLLVGRLARLFDHGTWFGVPDYVTFPKLLALVCCGFLFGAYYRVAAAMTRWPVAVTVVAGAITASIPSFVIWTFSGLENGLLAATVAWLSASISVGVIRGNLLSSTTAAACGLLAALAALTRPDGIVYAIAFPAAAILLAGERLSVRLRASLISVAVFAVPMVVYLMWRFATFDLLVPNTAVAKSQGLPGLRSIARPIELILFTGFAPALLGLWLVVCALRKRTKRTHGLLALLLMFGLAVLEYALLEPDWMAQRRFATPIWVTGSLIIAVAGAIVVESSTTKQRRVVTAVSVAASLVCVVVFLQSAVSFRRAPTVPVCAVASYAGWNVNAYASALGLEGATLVTPDVGGTGLVTKLRIIDLAGLTNRDVARRWADNDFAGLRDDIFGAEPEFIETHHGWSTITGLTDDARLASEYIPVSQTTETDGLWLRRDLSDAFAAISPAPTSPRSLPLMSDDPYQLVEPLASCGQLTSE